MTVALPGDRTYNAGSEVTDVTLEKRGDEVSLIAFDMEPQSLDEAYDRALVLAEEWGAPATNLEEARAAFDAGSTGDKTFSAATTGRPIVEGGPSVTVEIRYSFREEEPSLLSIQFSWTRS